jgi:hypothetical protein
MKIQTKPFLPNDLGSAYIEIVKQTKRADVAEQTHADFLDMIEAKINKMEAHLAKQVADKEKKVGFFRQYFAGKYRS